MKRGIALILIAGCSSGSAVARGQAEDWSLCRRDGLYDFFVPGLGPREARATADTTLESGSAVSPAEGIYEFSGRVDLRRADQRIAADRARYDQNTGAIEAEGSVQYQESTLLLAADKASGNLDQDRTELSRVRYQLLEARGNGEAESAKLSGGKHTDLTAVTFSTCDPGQRDWQISAREMQLDHEAGVGTARGMRLTFKGVPLLALPYASFPIDDRRRSGFLLPSIGGSNNGGFDLIVPYYLNLAPNYDATLSPRYIADRGFMAGGEFRYLGASQRGELRGTYLGDDDLADRDRHFYEWKHVGQFGQNFVAVADIRRVSDARYFEDFGDSLTASATSLLPSSAYLHGRGVWWNLAFGGDDIDVTDPRLPASAEPYRRLPRLAFDAEYPFADALRLGLRSELVRFDKDDALTGDRYDFEPYLAFPLERAFGFVRPEIGYRSTHYELDRRDEDSPSRSTAIASLDAGLFFDRATTIGGRALRQTLEPRLYYLYVPFEQQHDLPLFDTTELTFSFAQLFRRNRFSGGDRQQDANQLTAAISTRLIDDADGDELLHASLGQIRYFRDQRVQLPGVPATDFSGSSYAGELDFAAGENWRLAVSQLYNPNTDRTDLSSVRAQYRFADERGVANLAYRFRRGLLEQLDASTAFPINDKLRLIARWNYSLFDERTLEGLAGIEYESCCWALRLLGRHYVRSVEGDTNNAIFLELELKGLGTLGRKSEDLLTRSILGYR